jgi:hypothetical protein
MDEYKNDWEFGGFGGCSTGRYGDDCYDGDDGDVDDDGDFAERERESINE